MGYEEEKLEAIKSRVEELIDYDVTYSSNSSYEMGEVIRNIKFTLKSRTNDHIEDANYFVNNFQFILADIETWVESIIDGVV